MSRMKNLYEQVYRGRDHKPAPSINQAYANMYVESESDDVDTASEKNIKVYYSLTDTGMEQLDFLMNNESPKDEIHSFSMDKTYFEKKILGRLDQAMYKSAEKLIARIFNGQEDPVAFQALYNVMAENVMSNGTCEALMNFKDGANETANIPDGFISKFNSISKFDVFDVVPLLIDNLVAVAEINGDKITNPTRVVNQLWDVKDVQGRTSVGRGELAMCMFSQAIKGSPGDVVTKEDEPDLTTVDATNAGLAAAGLKIEVKGSGGRPGLTGFAKGFAGRVEEVLKKHTTEQTTTTMDVSSMSMEKKLQLKDQIAQAHSGINAETQVENVLKLFQLAGAEQEKIQELRSVLLVDDGQGGGDAAEVDTAWHVSVDQWLEDFETGVAQGLYKKTGWFNAKKILGKMAGAPPGGMKATIPNLIAYRASILQTLDVAVNPKSNFKDAVEQLFLRVLPFHQVSAELIADLLIETRTEEKSIGDNHDRLRTAIASQISSNVLVINNPIILSQAIGAMQLTSYCSADGFTHAMLVDDPKVGVDTDTNQKTSLVIKTDPGDPVATWTRCFTAFVQHSVKVPLSIDAQNKGVQLQFEAGGQG